MRKNKIVLNLFIALNSAVLSTPIFAANDVPLVSIGPSFYQNCDQPSIISSSSCTVENNNRDLNNENYFSSGIRENSVNVVTGNTITLAGTDEEYLEIMSDAVIERGFYSASDSYLYVVNNTINLDRLIDRVGSMDRIVGIRHSGSRKWHLDNNQVVVSGNKMTLTNSIISNDENYSGITSTVLLDQTANLTGKNSNEPLRFDITNNYLALDNVENKYWVNPSSIRVSPWAAASIYLINRETTKLEEDEKHYYDISFNSTHLKNSSGNTVISGAFVSITDTDREDIYQKVNMDFNTLSIENGDLQTGVIDRFTPVIAGSVISFYQFEDLENIYEFSSSNNTVTLSGSDLDLNERTVLAGAYVLDNNGQGLKFAGGKTTYNGFSFETQNNRLIFKANPVKIANILNFGYVDFYLSSQYFDAKAVNDFNKTAMISTKEAYLDNTSITIKEIDVSQGHALNAGDSVVLIRSESKINGKVDGSATAYQGNALTYDVAILTDESGHNIYAELIGGDIKPAETQPLIPIVPNEPKDPQLPGDEVPPTIVETPNPPITDPIEESNSLPGKVNPAFNSVLKGRMAEFTTLRDAEDIIYNHLQEYQFKNIDSGVVAFSPFILMEAGRSKYNEAGKLTNNLYNAAIGLDIEINRLLLGAFYETGKGDYKGVNNLALTRINSSGKSRYYGVGIFAKYLFENDLYVEGALRYGRTKTDFNTSDLRLPAHYDLKQNYVAGNVGIGRIVPLSEKSSMDLSLHYLWLTIGSKDVNVSGDPVHFNKAESQRYRAMAQYNYDITDTAVIFGGVGYEYEAKGKLNGTTYGKYALDEISLKGSTGIFQLGTSIKPSVNSATTFDFKFQGYVGERKGVTGSIALNYEL